MDQIERRTCRAARARAQYDLDAATFVLRTMSKGATREGSLLADLELDALAGAEHLHAVTQRLGTLGARGDLEVDLYVRVHRVVVGRRQLLDLGLAGEVDAGGGAGVAPAALLRVLVVEVLRVGDQQVG